MKKLFGIALGASLMAGCATGPVWFAPSSAPTPAQGYTVSGSDVTGTSSQVWVFGLGGTASESLQHRALKEALGNSNGADALVGMTIDEHLIAIWPFFVQNTIRVTGTPVKFNKK